MNLFRFVSLLAASSLALGAWAALQVRDMKAEIEKLQNEYALERDRVNEWLGSGKIDHATLLERVVKIDAQQEQIMSSVTDKEREERESYIFEISRSYAGTPQESEARKKALSHAQALQKLGALAPFKTPEEMVETFFRGALESKRRDK